MPFPRIAIAGAGMSGLCLAMQLTRNGFRSFQIYEKSPQLGGTWAENTYPNAGCDIPSFLYSFSFEPKHDWSQKYSRQPEILQYFRDCADKYDLPSKIRFNTAIEEARFDDAKRTWFITASDGTTEEYDFFISAVGQLNRPSMPNFDGIDSFQGASFHSARWDHDFDAKGKDVVCVGAGASAIQFLPELAERAKQLTIVQRSPNWIAPLKNYDYPGWAKSLFKAVPAIGRMHRLWIYALCESRFIAFKKDRLVSRIYGKWLKFCLRRRLPKSLHAKLMPDFPPGCKRILLSSDFYDTIERDNVRLLSDSITKVAPTGIDTAGEFIKADAIIYATGFETSNLLTPMEIVGCEEERLSQWWTANPGAYLGMMVPRFPNLFVLYGPNTNLGHNSIIYMVECQANYIIKCLKLAQKFDWKSLEVKPEAAEQYSNMVQRRLKQTVWNANCTSWYKTGDGVMVNNWCGPAFEYWWRTRKPDPSKLHTE